MRVEGKEYRSIWIHPNNKNVVRIINQAVLPFRFEIKDLTTPEDIIDAIKNMLVRGAPLIGAAGALGIYLAVVKLHPGNHAMATLRTVANNLKESRPTAVNLSFVIDQIMNKIPENTTLEELKELTYRLACERIEMELEFSRKIGEHGLDIIKEINKKKGGKPVNILTHCNAGWLACIDYGTATSPIYMAHDNGINVHVWVDETRPRNQGSKLTAWELGQHGVPYTIIADNAGGHLMQHGMVDLVIVGSDRTTRKGDVANKIGTYLKALAAHDNNIPFYVALPSSSFDFTITDGINEIPIEKRSSREITHIEGIKDDNIIEIEIVPGNAKAVNYGFDVTPAKYVTGIITERGICNADEVSITEMFSDIINK
ncbi:MAG: S-methyl-5-thioribose-1-phosphate isomerase [Bacteroidales bacterium]|nr:S-methyl-5-thioribose-1-phosphate isomerase [Bacteroidales bacterium]